MLNVNGWIYSPQNYAMINISNARRKLKYQEVTNLNNSTDCEITYKDLWKALWDCAAAYRCSVAEIIERALIAYLFSQHSTTARWVLQLYRGKKLSSVYAMAFGDLATMSEQVDATPLVASFCLILASNPYRFNGGEPELQQLIGQLKVICGFLPPNDPWHDEQLCIQMIQQFCSSPTNVWAADVGNLIYRNIEHLKSSRHTYQILSNVALIVASTLPDTAYTRRQFIQTLIEMSRDW